MFRTGVLFNVTGNIQVVFVLPDFLQGHRAGIPRNCKPTDNRIGDSFYIGGPKLITFSYLFKSAGGIDDHDVGVGPILFQNHDDGRDARAEEDVGRQPDYSVNVIEFQQLFADLSLRIAPKQNPMRQNDRHDSIRFKMVEVMKQESVIRF